MKLHPESRKNPVRARSGEVLGLEPPEPIDFNPERDITAAQKAALFQVLDGFQTGGDWENYAKDYLRLKVLWPQMEGRGLPSIPRQELQQRIQSLVDNNRLDLATMAAADIHTLGVPTDTFVDPTLPSTFLTSFDKDLLRVRYDPTLELSEALAIVRLGWRSVEAVFKERTKAWDRCQQTLPGYHTPELLSIYAKKLYQARLLFPEHLGELALSSADLRTMKQQLLNDSPRSTDKVGEYAFALRALTAERVTLGPNGEYQIETQRSVRSSPQLPERNLA